MMTESPRPPPIRRLRPRLDHLHQWAMAAGVYDDIWDVCCDHGRLGLHLHQTLKQSEKTASTRVHLVDCVASITDALSAQYASLMDPQLNITCLDAADIRLPPGRQLVLVAGVGVGTVMHILEKMTARLDPTRLQRGELILEFMLSPNLNVYELRRFLQKTPFELLNEDFVVDRGRYHEHLHLRYRAHMQGYEKATLVGSHIWSPLSKEKEHHLNTLITHYKNRVRMGGDTGAQHALEAYSKLLS